MTIRISMIAAAALALAACTTATPYGPADGSGRGFTDQRLESDRFRVTFAGNTQTPRDTVENYLLYRAAELTVQNGYDHFVMVEGKVDQKTSFRTYSTDAFGYYSFPYTVYGWGAAPYFGYYGRYPRQDYQTREYQEFTASAEILMRSGAKPDSEQLAYDAREVLRNLSTAIVRPNPR